MSDAERPITADMARTCWDEAAEAWDRFVEEGHDYYRYELFAPALAEACGDVAGRRVLDLGCGQGYFSRVLARRGADVVGIDWSEGQIANARRHEADHPLGIEYHVMDAMACDERLDHASFDLITGCLSLMDMPDPRRAIGAARSLLKPGAKFIFEVLHPATDTPFRRWYRDEDGGKIALMINDYFDRKPQMLHWAARRHGYQFDTVQYSFTLEQWFGMIRGEGLLIDRLLEPRPSREAVERHPDLDDCHRLPYALIFDVTPDTRAGKG